MFRRWCSFNILPVRCCLFSDNRARVSVRRSAGNPDNIVRPVSGGNCSSFRRVFLSSARDASALLPSELFSLYFSLLNPAFDDGLDFGIENANRFRRRVANVRLNSRSVNHNPVNRAFCGLVDRNIDRLSFYEFAGCESFW